MKAVAVVLIGKIEKERIEMLNPRVMTKGRINQRNGLNIKVVLAIGETQPEENQANKPAVEKEIVKKNENENQKTPAAEENEIKL